MHLEVATLRQRPVLFRMNSDQFTDLPDSDNFRLELLDGEVVMTSRPSPAHQHYIFQLGIVLDGWGKSQKLGRVFLDTQMTLDPAWSPIPDALFLATAHLNRVGGQRIDGAADLVVEVLSPSDEQADRRTKFEAYARFGIAWYWIVDLNQRQLEEYKRGRQAYGKPVIARFDQPFAPRLFKGLTIDLASLELDPGG
jgi:Uma2 family endonuclease